MKKHRMLQSNRGYDAQHNQILTRASIHMHNSYSMWIRKHKIDTTYICTLWIACWYIRMWPMEWNDNQNWIPLSMSNSTSTYCHIWYHKFLQEKPQSPPRTLLQISSSPVNIIVALKMLKINESCLFLNFWLYENLNYICTDTFCQQKKKFYPIFQSFF